MNRNEIYYTRQKLDKCANEVAHLLEKQEYSNFLNYYLFKLNYYLIKHQTLQDVAKEDLTKVKKDATE